MIFYCEEIDELILYIGSTDDGDRRLDRFEGEWLNVPIDFLTRYEWIYIDSLFRNE